MNLVHCENVMVKETETKGLGAFSTKKIMKNYLVEKGIIKRIDYDGNKNPFLFTWSENKDVWGFASGCATFYNTSRNPNTFINRNYDEDRFEIYALRDIEEGEELTHTYKSLEWRECFHDLKIRKDL